MKTACETDVNKTRKDGNKDNSYLGFGQAFSVTEKGIQARKECSGICAAHDLELHGQEQVVLPAYVSDLL